MPPAAALHGHTFDLRTAFALARDEAYAHSAPPLPSLGARGDAQLRAEPVAKIVRPPPPVPVAPPAAPQPPPPEPIIAWGALLPEGVGVVRPPPPQPVQPPPSPPPGPWSAPGLNMLTGSKAKCSTVPDLIDKGTFSCGTGKAYDVAKKDEACTAGTCAAPADVSKCCSDQAKCSSIKDNAGTVCGTGKGYDTINANVFCASATCSKDTPTDVAACCIPTGKAKCRDVPGLITEDKFSCGTGKAYDVAKKDEACTAGTCAAPADVSKCCSDQAKCSSIKDNAGTVCGTGKGYDTINANVFCASATCSKDTPTDVAACCIPTGKAKCRDVPGLIDKEKFSCGTGKAYDVAKKDEACTAGTRRAGRREQVLQRPGQVLKHQGQRRDRLRHRQGLRHHQRQRLLCFGDVLERHADRRGGVLQGPEQGQVPLHQG